MLPLIVVALIVPPFLGFAVGGAAIGTAVGMATLAILVWIAAHSGHGGPIELAGDQHDSPVLAVALAAIEDGVTANRIATLAEATGGDADYSVLVLAPSQSSSLQRWLSDEGPGRIAAQERLAVSIATLAAAGCHAEGRVVDQSPAQAIEDIAAQHGAQSVVFIVSDRSHDRAIAELTRRLDRPVRRIAVPPGLAAPDLA